MHDEYALDAELPHVRHFTHVLSALRLSKKQLVRVGVSDRGITFVAVDDSKSVQAQASFRAETFSFFSANPGAASSRSQRGGHGHASSSTSNTSFDVSLQALIDTLNVFAPLDGETTVRMRWPDLDGKLVFAAAAQRDGARVSDDLVRNVTHASIATQDGSGNNTAAGTSSSTLNSELTFRGEKNAFMVATTTLKEIVDDLEWPGGYGSSTANGGTKIEMRNRPKQMLRFTAKSQETGELVVDVDVPGNTAAGGGGGQGGGGEDRNNSSSNSTLSEFRCDEPGAWRYRHRFLKASLSVPLALLQYPSRGGDGGGHGHGGNDKDGGGHTTTRVAIGEGGMLKIVHLVRFASSGNSSFGVTNGNTNGGMLGTNGLSGGSLRAHGTGAGGSSDNPTARGLGGRQSVVVPITFIAYPEEEAEGEE